MLATCNNIQKGYNISLKQLTNWLVTLFITSHTCDKLFNSVDPNKSKSKQLANSVRGLFVAIYRCAQAVLALQSPIKGKPFNDSLEMTSITQHIWQSRIWQPILLHLRPGPQQLFTCFQSVLCCCKQTQNCRTRRLSNFQEQQVE